MRRAVAAIRARAGGWRHPQQMMAAAAIDDSASMALSGLSPSLSMTNRWTWSMDDRLPDG
jgi:hypothetical protein